MTLISDMKIKSNGTNILCGTMSPLIRNLNFAALSTCLALLLYANLCIFFFCSVVLDSVNSMPAMFQNDQQLLFSHFPPQFSSFFS